MISEQQIEVTHMKARILREKGARIATTVSSAAVVMESRAAS
jgi:hypothetical protein